MVIAKCSVLLCTVLVLTMAMQYVAESRRAASLELQHRKFFMEKKSEMGFNGGTEYVSNGKNEMTEDWQLRRVPAGPDPMHHHGQDPKPRTP